MSRNCNEKKCDVRHNVTHITPTSHCDLHHIVMYITTERASLRYGLGSHGWEPAAPAAVSSSDSRDAKPNDPPQSPCCPARQGQNPVATDAPYAACTLLMFSQGLLKSVLEYTTSREKTQYQKCNGIVTKVINNDVDNLEM